MGPHTSPGHFYLYLWRSPNSPGTLYLAEGFETAEALCRGLTDDGYIVKVVHMATNTEYELQQGKLYPAAEAGASEMSRRFQDEDFAINKSGSDCALP
jgi:hypothetical protein